jgi:hypothetical protein
MFSSWNKMKAQPFKGQLCGISDRSCNSRDWICEEEVFVGVIAGSII